MTAKNTTRTRTVTWEDPATGAAAARTMSGLDYLRALQRGELPAPPISALLGMAFETVEEGRVVFALVPSEEHYNPIGTVHGGIPATLLDSAMGCAIHTMLPAGAGYTTLQLDVKLVRGITTATGRLRCEGTIVHVGGRTATAQGHVVDETGTLYAHGTTTCLIMRG